MHIRFRSIQMEITKSQYGTNCVKKWLVCISARHAFHVFTPYRIMLLLGCKLGNDRNFGLVRGSADFGRFGKNFAELFVIQFHAHLQYTGIKRTDYAILCNKSFSQSQQNSTIHISTTPFYVVKLSACCGEGFYIHALIL